jgi:hypothetical protein
MRMLTFLLLDSEISLHGIPLRANVFEDVDTNLYRYNLNCKAHCSSASIATPFVTLWCFISQALDPDKSLRNAVALLKIYWRLDHLGASHELRKEDLSHSLE